jgi:hypothetical protein
MAAPPEMAEAALKSSDSACVLGRGSGFAADDGVVGAGVVGAGVDDGCCASTQLADNKQMSNMSFFK